MMEAVQEWVTIGFSATTGQNVERNILLSWEFNSSLEIKQENGNIRRKKRKIALAVVLPVAGGLLVIMFVIFKKRRSLWPKGRSAANLTSMNYEWKEEEGLEDLLMGILLWLLITSQKIENWGKGDLAKSTEGTSLV